MSSDLWLRLAARCRCRSRSRLRCCSARCSLCCAAHARQYGCSCSPYLSHPRDIDGMPCTCPEHTISLHASGCMRKTSCRQDKQRCQLGASWQQIDVFNSFESFAHDVCRSGRLLWRQKSTSSDRGVARGRRCRVGFRCSRMFPECPHWMLSGGRAGAAGPGSCPQQSARGIGADGGAAGTARRQGEAAEPHAHAQGRTCTFVSQHCGDFALLCHVTRGGAAAGHTTRSAPLGSLLIILSD